jgi:F0F1-type ATP synthase assembly protein I
MAKDRRDSGDDRPWMRLGGIGIELAAAVGGFAVVGHLVDRYRGSHPKGLLIGAVLGLIGGMYNLIKASLAASREAREGDREKAADKDRRGEP